MRYMINLLAIGFLLIGLPGCKKQYPQPEQRWLHIYYDGEFVDSINITGWEVNEDVVPLGHFYYPWQGEDSIDYNNYFDYWELGPGSHRCWFVLNVNSKLVSVDPFIIPPSKIKHPENITTLIGMPEYNIDILDSFPNLVSVSTSVNARTIDSLSTFPSNIRLYVFCSDITNADLRRLSRYSNIRTLQVEESRSTWLSGRGCNPTASGFRALRRMKELRVLWVHGLFEDSDEIDKYLKNLPRLSVTRVWIYDEL